MESDQRGRASRASSTSSLGREVRCGCQYYQSDSLLPERRALFSRPPSRTMQQPPAVRCSEHEYEPIAAPSPRPAVAPVVRITDTDVVPVADSDDSIDDRSRLPPELTQAGDVRLPLDGQIEDNAMEGHELVETGDTSEETETPQQLQERLEERYLSPATPGAESRTDGEVNTSQVDSLALEELPLRRGARGLPQKLKTQAGKLRTRLKNIQRPSFAFADKPKPEKVKSTTGSSRSDRSRSEKRPSRMDRIRSSFSERPRLSLPNRPRFSLPDRSKFHLPERPKFNLKKPNIRLPNALTRTKKTTPSDEQPSTESVGSRKNIFEFATYPRIFERKSKNKVDYVTSTPKDSRDQSVENATFPRTQRRRTSWAQRFNETTPYIDEDRPDAEAAVHRSRPWRHPSMEEPRLSISMTEEALASLPWEEKRRLEQIRYMDYEESTERSDRQDAPRSETPKTEEESYERERIEAEPRYRGAKENIEEAEEDWVPEEEADPDFRPIPRSRSLEEVLQARKDVRYEGFAMVDPRRYGVHKTPSEEEEEEYDDDMEDEDHEPSSAQSDREQQHSSGSSCDRRRRGIVDEVDFDAYFARQAEMIPEDVRLGKYLTHEIREALGANSGNALADEEMVPIPPERSNRKRALLKRREEESFEEKPPVRPQRDPNRVRRSESADDQFRERTRSDSRHRVVYQAEGFQEIGPPEPLDDIVVVKPVRRKSKSSQRSQSQGPMELPRPPSPTPVPPVVPTRRKRLRKDPFAVDERRNGERSPVCNGHGEWIGANGGQDKSLPPASSDRMLAGQEVYTAEDILAASEENIERRLRDEEYVPPAPVPPKRRSRSRGTSVAQDEDRTSHGAESLPEAGYVEEDIPPDDMDYGRDLSGYAIIEKREKPPRPPPPRRKKDKFATAPKPAAPKRPQRAYSTLGPGRTKDTEVLSESFIVEMEPVDSTPYIEIDSDGGEHKDLRSTEVLSKMQGRPLPAPPRPPRVRKEKSLDRSTPVTQDFSTETTTATQTDPLPDDMIIEEEITQAKLVVAPASSGSQIMVSTERIPTPSVTSAPPVPPLPLPQRSRKEDKPGSGFDTVSLKAPSLPRELESFEDRHLSAPDLEGAHESMSRDEEALIRSIRSALLSDEPVRISNLEVGDLRVDRLSVSQIDAGKIVASEVDALVITTSELKNIGSGLEESLSPSIVKELIAIRSHLETVAATRAQEDSVGRKTAVAETKADIPVTERQSVPREPEERASIRQRSPEDTDRPMSIEDQKVVNREIVEPRDNKSSITHTLTVAQVEVRELPVTHHTLTVSRVGPSDGAIHSPNTQSSSVVENIEDKPLRISDSETPLSLSSATAKQPMVEAPRPSPLSSTETTGEKTMESTMGLDRYDTTESTPPPEFARLADSPDKESSPDQPPQPTPRKSRSRSPSPIGIPRTRQTASPVRSLPPAISVTPDTPECVTSHGDKSHEMQPQRAVISYSSYRELSDRDSLREASISPTPSFPIGGTHLIAFPASDVPAHFLSLTNQHTPVEPNIADSIRQLMRVLRMAVLKATRRFVDHLSSTVGIDEAREHISDVELVLCGLMVLIVGLLIFFFTNARSVTHHHHWDYFNPPK